MLLEYATPMRAMKQSCPSERQLFAGLSRLPIRSKVAQKRTLPIRLSDVETHHASDRPYVMRAHPEPVIDHVGILPDRSRIKKTRTRAGLSWSDSLLSRLHSSPAQQASDANGQQQQRRGRRHDGSGQFEAVAVIDLSPRAGDEVSPEITVPDRILHRPEPVVILIRPGGVEDRESGTRGWAEGYRSDL